MKIVLNSVLDTGGYNLSVTLDNGNQHGVKFTKDVDPKIYTDLLIDTVMRKELGFTKHDLLMKVAPIYEI